MKTFSNDIFSQDQSEQKLQLISMRISFLFYWNNLRHSCLRRNLNHFFSLKVDEVRQWKEHDRNENAPSRRKTSILIVAESKESWRRRFEGSRNRVHQIVTTRKSLKRARSAATDSFERNARKMENQRTNDRTTSQRKTKTKTERRDRQTKVDDKRFFFRSNFGSIEHLSLLQKFSTKTSRTRRLSQSVDERTEEEISSKSEILTFSMTFFSIWRRTSIFSKKKVQNVTSRSSKKSDEKRWKWELLEDRAAKIIATVHQQPIKRKWRIPWPAFQRPKNWSSPENVALCAIYLWVPTDFSSFLWSIFHKTKKTDFENFSIDRKTFRPINLHICEFFYAF